MYDGKCSRLFVVVDSKSFSSSLSGLSSDFLMHNADTLSVILCMVRLGLLNKGNREESGEMTERAGCEAGAEDEMVSDRNLMSIGELRDAEDAAFREPRMSGQDAINCAFSCADSPKKSKCCSCTA